MFKMFESKLASWVFAVNVYVLMGYGSWCLSDTKLLFFCYSSYDGSKNTHTVSWVVKSQSTHKTFTWGQTGSNNNPEKVGKRKPAVATSSISAVYRNSVF